MKDQVTFNTTTTYPRFLSTDPISATLGDYYYQTVIGDETNTGVWKRFNGATWDTTDDIWLGYFILDDVENVAAVSNEFDHDYKRDLDIHSKFVDIDNTNVKINRASIAGIPLAFEENPGENISLAANLIDTGAGVQPNTLYYKYLDSVGNVNYSPTAPHPLDKRQGYYHPTLCIRCIGTVFTNGSSEIVPFIFEDGKYTYESSNFTTNLTGSFARFEFPDVPPFAYELHVHWFLFTTTNVINDVQARLRGSSSVFLIGNSKDDSSGGEAGGTANIPVQNSTLELKEGPNNSAIQVIGFKVNL